MKTPHDEAGQRMHVARGTSDPALASGTVAKRYPLDPSQYGEPRINAGPAGRAVHLSVIVRWLMERHEATRAHAVTELLLPALEASPTPSLFFARRGQDALGIQSKQWFQSTTGDQLTPRSFSNGLGRGLRHVSDTVASLGFGGDGAIAWLRLRWGGEGSDSVMEDGRAAASFLIVSEADAAVLWGYGLGVGVGEKTTPSSLDAATQALREERVAAKGSQWTPDQEAEVRRLFHELGGWKKDGSGGYVKDSGVQDRLAKGLGLTNRSSIERFLRAPPAQGEFAMYGMAASLINTG